MAHIGSMLLVEPGAPPTSGAVFYLNAAAKEDAVETVDGVWTVEIRKQSRCVVARGGTESSYEEARNTALSMAQKGLDFFSITGVSDRAVVDAENEHLCWWIEPAGVVLRYVNQLILRFSMSSIVTVTDAAGNPLPAATLQPKLWNESYRYFRLSQVTDDLFDAYRNLFLALESLLSTVTPVQALGPSKKGIQQYERDGDWLKRAFEEVERRGLITLADFAAPGVADPREDIIRDFFETNRTALFHAKQTRATLLPHDASQRTSVTESLVRLSRVYIELAQNYFQLNRGASVVSDYALQQMPVSRYTVSVSDDETPLALSESSIYREGRRLVTLVTREAVELNAPYLRNVLGILPTAQTAGLNGISRTFLADTDGKIRCFDALVDKLTLDGTERFEVLFRVRLVNRLAKKYYGM